jgi:hypothetical protein
MEPYHVRKNIIAKRGIQVDNPKAYKHYTDLLEKESQMVSTKNLRDKR